MSNKRILSNWCGIIFSKSHFEMYHNHIFIIINICPLSYANEMFMNKWRRKCTCNGFLSSFQHYCFTSITTYFINLHCIVPILSGIVTSIKIVTYLLLKRKKNKDIEGIHFGIYHIIKTNNIDNPPFRIKW